MASGSAEFGCAASARAGFTSSSTSSHRKSNLAERIAVFHGAGGVSPPAREVAVAREMFVADTQAEKDAAIAHMHRARQQILGVSRAPGQETGIAYPGLFARCAALDANTLIGTPDEIADRLEGLRNAGADYLILSCGGSCESLRRFAREIMPAFAGEREA